MDGKKKLEELVAGLDGVTTGFGRWIRLFGDRTVYTRDPQDGCRIRAVVRADDPGQNAVLDHIARCDPDTIRSISDAYKAMEAERDALRRLIVDRDYMLHAYRNMLGPKGREVADMWTKRGVQRTHFDWGPKAQDMSGEDRAAFILELENTLWTPVDNIDALKGGSHHEG